MATPLRVAFYLPQYHPTPENDEWWGPGFSEWTTVASAKRRFPGHRQPRLPGKLGFYDLRLAETRATQSDMAQAVGIDAFCYWHYWFSGQRLLERPFEEVLATGEPGIGFCLGWANESWTAAWIGKPGTMLVEQRYDRDDHVAHMRYLCEAFRDPRYVRVDGRPVVYVYRPSRIPSPDDWRELWDTTAAEEGQERPFIVGEIDSRVTDGEDLLRAGVLDAATAVSWNEAFGRFQRYYRRVRPIPLRVDYTKAATGLSLDRARADGRFQPVLLTGWDNTPRYGRRGVVLTGCTPDALRAVAEDAEAIASTRTDHPVLWVKSWNEWSEGNYLEPDRDTGDAYARAIAGVFGAAGPSVQPPG